MELNEKFAKLRKGLGLSQEELAEALGVSRQAVSKWETGQSTPDLENLVRLCRLYGIPADELLETGLFPSTATENPAEQVIQTGLSRRLVTLGWVGVLVSAVLLVCEFIALFFIKNMEIEFAIARGAGFHMELSWYATHFPMNLVFSITALLAVSGIALILYALWKQQKIRRNTKK